MARSPHGWSVAQRLDVLGILLVLVLAVWVGLFAGGGEGRPGPVLWLLAAMVVAFAISRVLGRRPGLVHRIVAIAIAGAVAITWPEILHAGGAPTGYGNANATLTSLGVLGAIGAARLSRSPADRRGWIALVVGLTVATFLTGSVAGTASLLVALVLLGLSAATRSPGITIVGGLIAVSLVFAATTAIALGVDPADLGPRADVRTDLWAAAVDLVGEEPVRGIGPGEFDHRSQVSSDADLRWAHHGYLQAAAEYGIAGLLLVIALAGWAWVRVWYASRGRRAGAVLAGASLTIVGLHATVDHVWHIPAVMVLLAVLLGEGTSSRALTHGAGSTQSEGVSAATAPVGDAM